MKNLLILGLLAFGALTSCVQNDDFDTNGSVLGQEIVFKTKASSTRAIVTGTTMSDNFGVYGYVTENATAIGGETSTTNGGYIMKNAEYDNNGDVVGSTHYYWPKADNNSDITTTFTAYAPYKAAGVTITTESTIDYINIPVTASSLNEETCSDVLYAFNNTAKPQNASTEGNHYRVPLEFNHALAWVQFVARFDNTSVKAAKITNIEIELGDGTPTTIKTSGTLKLNTTNGARTWDLTAATTASPDFSSKDGSTHIDLTNAFQVLSNMLVVPQNVPAKIKITYNVTIEGADGDIYYNGRTVTKTINSGTDMKPTPTAYASTWSEGNKYQYRITIKGDEINFAPSVSAWELGDDNWWQVWDTDNTTKQEVF